MILWRDRWDDAPQVVILAYDDPQGSELQDAVLMLREDLIALPLLMSDQQGQRWSVLLPEDFLSVETPFVQVGIDLTVEPK